MHTALLDRSVDALKAVRMHVSFSANLRSQIGQTDFGCKSEGPKCFDLGALLGQSADVNSWRKIDHCAAISRAYALFEEFVAQLLREYLVFLAKSYTLSDLGKDFVAKYTRGIGQILLDQDRARYENIDIAVLVADASHALSSGGQYQIQPEAMLRTEQNLRMGELERLFGHCGLSGLQSWISNHSAIRMFFGSSGRLSGTVESELQEIVKYRNEAAHGDVDQVLGNEVLVEITEFFEALVRGLTDFVQYETLNRAKQLGKVKVLGVISERFKDDIVVAKITNATLTVGDQVYVQGNKLTMLGRIESIQLDGVPCEVATIASVQEVGLRLGVRAKTGCELLQFL